MSTYFTNIKKTESESTVHFVFNVYYNFLYLIIIHNFY